MPTLSLSTWSLHRILGPLRWTGWNPATLSHETQIEDQPELLKLLDLPAEAAKRGYQAVEICHFHFPSTDEAYLERLNLAFREAGVSFDTLLLDYGDLTAENRDRAEADRSFMARWIGIASRCGAKRIRLVAGEAPPSDNEAIDRSAHALAALSEYAEGLGVRVVTENFKPLTSTGASSLKLLDRTGGKVGFITDFGNFSGSAKYEEISRTVPFSSSVHVKPQYDANGIPDERELKRCLDAVQAEGYDGSFVLIYDGPGDMWEGLERVKRLVHPYINHCTSH
ncbi:sugar phosphate isomerase/epimerase family protein [Paenibacillus thailandensis]|uniref:Sugar phosphate isomerase/epimerase family protein n=1 Tax=Paenibacillus thailandensis TaxID=393250 RepID=A0ABW5QTW5_9BACL